MTKLEEYKQKFLGKTVCINWAWGNDRKGATNSEPTKDVIVKDIYENCHGEILCEFESKITVPVRVERLYV